MMYSDVIELVADSTTRDEDGYPVTEETKTEVYANVKSVKRTEFYEAMRSGVTAAVVFEMFFPDYGNQRIVDYNGVRYQVERTYKTTIDSIELTCSEVRRL